MSINFAAVHERKRWRKHCIHQSLQAAIDGKDGAKNLLQRVGRVAVMWQKYGDVYCVFVWEDNANNGQVMRLSPTGNGAVETATVDTSLIGQFDVRKGCSAEEIAQCFAVAHPPVAGTVSPIDAFLYPDELPVSGSYVEGLAQQTLVNGYERSAAARESCIRHYGCTCQVCLVDFNQRYGSIGAGFIHVHHRTPIASVGAEYQVDPIRDLVPVCPNCHAMLHRYDPPLEIADLRALLHND